MMASVSAVAQVVQANGVEVTYFPDGTVQTLQVTVPS